MFAKICFVHLSNSLLCCNCRPIFQQKSNAFMWLGSQVPLTINRRLVYINRVYIIFIHVFQKQCHAIFDASPFYFTNGAPLRKANNQTNTVLWFCFLSGLFNNKLYILIGTPYLLGFKSHNNMASIKVFYVVFKLWCF